MFSSRGRRHPFILVIVAALVFSQLPSLAWAQEKKLPSGWIQDAARRHAVLVEAKAGTISFTLQQAGTEPAGRSRKSKMLMGIGVGVAGAGAIMVAAGPSKDEQGYGFNIDWKLTGALWLAGGAAIAIWGLVTK